MKNKIIIILFVLSLVLIIFFNNFVFDKKESVERPANQNVVIEESTYNSNIILDVNYSSVDMNGNEYIINAEKGEIDFNDSNVIYLTNVNAIIKPKMKDLVKVKSKFGKYNINNFDTIFSKNVIIEYLENKITGEYLDFSPNRNSMIVSKNIVYTNPSVPKYPYRNFELTLCFAIFDRFQIRQQIVLLFRHVVSMVLTFCEVDIHWDHNHTAKPTLIWLQI